MTNREEFYFWLGVALRDDEIDAADIDAIRAGTSEALARTRFAREELIAASVGYLHNLSPYLAQVTELAREVWSEQFDGEDPDRHIPRRPGVGSRFQ